MLLATANTPADQQKLASYYHEKARQLTAKAQEFIDQASAIVEESKTGSALYADALFQLPLSELLRQRRQRSALPTEVIQ